MNNFLVRLKISTNIPSFSCLVDHSVPCSSLVFCCFFFFLIVCSRWLHFVFIEWFWKCLHSIFFSFFFTSLRGVLFFYFHQFFFDTFVILMHRMICNRLTRLNIYKHTRIQRFIFASQINKSTNIVLFSPQTIKWKMNNNSNNKKRLDDTRNLEYFITFRIATAFITLSCCPLEILWKYTEEIRMQTTLFLSTLKQIDFC